MKKLILEEVVKPSDDPNLMSFWHGGDLSNISLHYQLDKAQKKGHYEYGPGLYLTTHYGTARKYAKGSRRLYMVYVRKGNDIKGKTIDMAKIEAFLDNASKKDKKEAMGIMSQYVKGGMIEADRFHLIMLNYGFIKPFITVVYKRFLVENGIDYMIVDSPFGWNEKMLVLFNTSKIQNAVAVGSKDKIEVFDLPTDF